MREGAERLPAQSNIRFYTSVGATPTAEPHVPRGPLFTRTMTHDIRHTLGLHRRARAHGTAGASPLYASWKACHVVMAHGQSGICIRIEAMHTASNAPWSWQQVIEQQREELVGIHTTEGRARVAQSRENAHGMFAIAGNRPQRQDSRSFVRQTEHPAKMTHTKMALVRRD